MEGRQLSNGIVSEGDRVVVTGRLLMDLSTCEAFLSPRELLDIGVNAQTLLRQPGESRVRLSGVDMEKLPNLERGGGFLGCWLTVEGVWTERHIAVESQGDPGSFTDGWSRVPMRDSARAWPTDGPSIVDVVTHLDDRLRVWDVIPPVRVGAYGVYSDTVVADVGRILPPMIDWAESLPPGVVELIPWIRPAGPRMQSSD